jgi:hypothetical protein
MQTFLLWARRALVALVATCTTTTATSQTQRYPDMDSYGTNRPNACAPAQQTLLKKEVTDGATDAAPAWTAIVSMLCGTDDSGNRQRIKRFVPAQVREAVEGTGQAPVFQRIQRSDALIRRLSAGGKAWEASVQVESDTIVLQYFPDEACVASRTLRHTKTGWMLAEIGEVCD